MNNPWRLPPREAEAMTKMAERGSEKAVAVEMGVSPSTVSELVNRARKRIGTQTRLTAIVTWDRWARAQQ